MFKAKYQTKNAWQVPVQLWNKLIGRQGLISWTFSWKGVVRMMESFKWASFI